MEVLTQFFASNFSSCLWLAVIILALIPTFESKIAIPFAVSVGLSPWSGFFLTFLGSFIPCLVAIFVARKIKSHTTGFVTGYIKDKYSAKTNILEKQDGKFRKYFSLACFVALPLPLTGVWAGGFIAGFSSLNTFKAFVSVMSGSFVSCLIMTILSTVFENSIGYILAFSIAIVVIFLSVDLFLSFFKRKKKKSN